MAARTAADGVGAREWVEMDGEKKPLGMSELGCADGSAWVQEWLEMDADKKPLGMSETGCADGCGRSGCKGVAGSGWGEEAAGDERAWLRGRAADGMGAREWLEMRGEKKQLGMSELGCADFCGRQMGAEQTAADGVGARMWLEMGWEKKPLGMSEQTDADGVGGRSHWG